MQQLHDHPQQHQRPPESERMWWKIQFQVPRNIMYILRKNIYVIGRMWNWSLYIRRAVISVIIYNDRKKSVIIYNDQLKPVLIYNDQLKPALIYNDWHSSLPFHKWTSHYMKWKSQQFSSLLQTRWKKSHLNHQNSKSLRPLPFLHNQRRHGF